MTRYVIILSTLICFFTSTVWSSCSQSYHCADMTCGSRFDQNIWTSILNNQTSCQCEWEDIGARFTPCDPSTQTKELIYYYRPPATCSGGISLPNPIKNIPCNTNCEGGHVFSKTTMACEKCKPGTFSAGSTISYTSFLGEEWPSPFDTFCLKSSEAGGDCSAWKRRGDYLDSGENYENSNVQSWLTYRIEVGQNARVSFDYQVFGEEGYWGTLYDYLTFSIRDNDRKSSIMIRDGIQQEWKHVEFNLTAGFVELVWIYQKDSSYSSSVAGGDRAKIRNLVIDGSIQRNAECSKCELGEFSNEGSTQCEKCQPGTYQDEKGQKSCKQCPPLTKSYEGAQTCFPESKPCTSNDYFSYHTDCDTTSNTWTRVYDWISPKLCNSTSSSSIQLPDSIQEPCAQPKCQPGQEPQDYHCAYCPQNTASSDGTECNACESNQLASNFVSHISEFLPNSNFFDTGCSGQCQSNGWRFLSNFADSGVGNGVSSSYLLYNVTFEDGYGVIHTHYSLSCPKDAGELEIHLDDQVQQVLICSGCSNDTKRIELSVKGSGQHQVKYVYRTFLHTSEELNTCDMAKIYQISMHGPIQSKNEQGASKCEVCPEGYKKHQNACEMCNPGEFASAGATECTQCQRNTFAPSGSGRCYPCGKGMKSDPGSSECEFLGKQAEFKKKVGNIDRVFAWKDLAETLNGKSIKSGVAEFPKFYLNLAGHTHQRSRDAQDVYPCSENSFACRVDENGKVSDIGSALEIDASMSMLVLTARNYIAQCNRTVSPDGSIVSRIEIGCSIGAPQSPTSVSVSVENPCYYVFRLESNQGCALCTEKDFSVDEGVCRDDGTRIISYFKLGGLEHQCANGFVPPPDKEEKCAPPVPPSPEETKFPYWIIAVIVIVVVLVIIILFILALFSASMAVLFYKKFKTSEEEKKALLSNRSFEMSEQEVAEEREVNATENMDEDSEQQV